MEEKSATLLPLERLETVKEIAKVGKRFIKKLIGIADVRKRIEFVPVPANQLPNHHLTCPFLRLNSEFNTTKGTKLCHEHCSQDIRTVERVVYVDEDDKYISHSLAKGLSKLQIKQLLLYHFLHIDSQGIIKHLFVKDIACMLGCHPRSVRYNNRVFEETGLAFVSYVNLSNGKECFSVALKDYSTHHLSKDEGGEGFFRVSKNAFAELLSIDNVNVLRLELFKLMQYDNDTIKRNVQRNHEAFSILSYDKIKKLLPSYTRYRSKIESFLEQESKIFENDKEHSALKFKLKDEFNGKIVRAIKQKEARKVIEPLIYNYRVNSFGKDRDDITNDLVQLSLEYSLPLVMEALKEVDSTYNIRYGIEQDESKQMVTNLVGLVREIIRIRRFKNLVS